MVDRYFALPGGLTACFRTASALGRRERLQLGAYVPGIAVMGGVPARADITIEHEFSESPGLADDGANIRLCAPRGDGSLPADIYHLFYGAVRRTLLERGFYSVHAACVGNGDDYTLIVGHSGAGKTTLTQRLVEKHDMKLFSGNKTVVRFDPGGGITAVAGTRTMTSLDGNLNRHAYEMNPADYAPQAQASIKSIVIVRVNDGVEEAQELSRSSALHALYPYFMDAVNADVIVNGRDVFNGAANSSARERLAAGLALSVAAIPVRKYSGNMNFLERKVLPP